MLKVAVVTGGARGIGRAISLLFARNGYTVVINYNQSEQNAFSLLEQIKSEGLFADIFKADVSNSDECKSLFGYVKEKYSRLDVLVCNAGIAKQNPITLVSDDEWNKIISTNLSSAFYCTRSAVPLFLQEKSGSIVMVSSVFGITGASCEAAYSASKGGMITFAKSMASELSPSGITVNCVCPGFIDTDINNNLSIGEKQRLVEDIPLNRAGTIEEIARSVYFLATESYITGQVLSVDGGYSL